MGYDDRSQIGEDGCLHHFSWMHNTRIQTSDMANIDSGRLIFRVKADNDKLLAVSFRKKWLQQPVRIFRGLDLALLVQHARLTNELQTHNVDALRWLFDGHLPF